MRADALLTVAQVAERLGLSVPAVLSLVNTGRIRAINVSQGSSRPRWRIEPDELTTWLESRQTRPVARRLRRRRSELVEYV